MYGLRYNTQSQVMFLVHGWSSKNHYDIGGIQSHDGAPVQILFKVDEAEKMGDVFLTHFINTGRQWRPESAGASVATVVSQPALT